MLHLGERHFAPLGGSCGSTHLGVVRFDHIVNKWSGLAALYDGVYMVGILS